MRKLLRVTALLVALATATAAHTPTAKAGVDDCTYAAQQWCKGVQGPDGQYYYPGGPGWVACVEDAKQYLLVCEPRPSNGPTGGWCFLGRDGWGAC